MAEKGRRWSPYNYVLNNPIRNIDPDGMWTAIPGGYTTSDAGDIAAFTPQINSWLNQQWGERANREHSENGMAGMAHYSPKGFSGNDGAMDQVLKTIGASIKTPVTDVESETEDTSSEIDVNSGWPIGFFVDPKSIKLGVSYIGFDYHWGGNIKNIFILAYDDGPTPARTVLVAISNMYVQIQAINTFGKVVYQKDAVNNVARGIEYGMELVYTGLENGLIHDTPRANKIFVAGVNKYLGEHSPSGIAYVTAPYSSSPSSNLKWTIFPWRLW